MNLGSVHAGKAYTEKTATCDTSFIQGAILFCVTLINRLTINRLTINRLAINRSEINRLISHCAVRNEARLNHHYRLKRA